MRSSWRMNRIKKNLKRVKWIDYSNYESPQFIFFKRWVIIKFKFLRLIINSWQLVRECIKWLRVIDVWVFLMEFFHYDRCFSTDHSFFHFSSKFYKVAIWKTEILCVCDIDTLFDDNSNDPPLPIDLWLFRLNKIMKYFVLKIFKTC